MRRADRGLRLGREIWSIGPQLACFWLRPLTFRLPDRLDSRLDSTWISA